MVQRYFPLQYSLDREGTTTIVQPIAHWALKMRTVSICLLPKNKIFKIISVFFTKIILSLWSSFQLKFDIRGSDSTFVVDHLTSKQYVSGLNLCLVCGGYYNGIEKGVFERNKIQFMVEPFWNLQKDALKVCFFPKKNLSWM